MHLTWFEARTSYRPQRMTQNQQTPLDPNEDMASHDSDSAFDEAMSKLHENVKESLSPELRDLFRRTDIANPAGAVRVLHKFLSLSAQPCTEEVKIEVGNAILEDSNPVDLFFSCLPDPQGHEMRYTEYGDFAIIDAYNRAHDALKYFTITQGKTLLKLRYTTSILNQLLKILNRVDKLQGVSYPAFERYNQWSENLLSLVWKTRNAVDIRKTHSAHTQNLIDYLVWDIRGRKDSSCNVRKPWATIDPAETRRSADSDLSRLPQDASSGKCAKCHTEGAHVRFLGCWLWTNEDRATGTVYCSQKCLEEDMERHAVFLQESIKLFRLSTLFQITFTQYLLSTNYEVNYTVSEIEGMAQSYGSGTAPSGLIPETIYEGVSPDLDLSLPKVQAVLQAYSCCAIKDPARALLEYFFRCE